MIITVYPTKASALNVKHPHGPQMTIGGVLWPKDGFTGRRLSDGSVTTDETKAYVAPEDASAEAAVAAEAQPIAPSAPLTPSTSVNKDGASSKPADAAG